MIFLNLYFLANVPEIDGPTDLALAEVLYRASSKYSVKYILEGHSFILEGISPLGSVYVDGKYIKSIHKQFGKMKMKTFSNMDFISFMKRVLIKRIRKYCKNRLESYNIPVCIEITKDQQVSERFKKVR